MQLLKNLSRHQVAAPALCCMMESYLSDHFYNMSFRIMVEISIIANTYLYPANLSICDLICKDHLIIAEYPVFSDYCDDRYIISIRSPIMRTARNASPKFSISLSAHSSALILS